MYEVTFVEYLERNNLYYQGEHGLRASKSVTTASNDLIERIVGAIDRSDTVTRVFMDPCKSFENVHHIEFLSTRESRNHWYSTELV